MTDLICYHCLTEDSKNEPAVTTLRGTAVCEKCARETAENQQAADQAFRQQQQTQIDLIKNLGHR